MKCIVFGRYRRPLACLLFGSAAWKVACRDQAIGWDTPTRPEDEGSTENIRHVSQQARSRNLLPYTRDDFYLEETITFCH